MTTTLSGSQLVEGGWLIWDIRIGAPVDRGPVSLPGFGETRFTTEVNFDDPTVRASLRIAHVRDPDAPVGTPVPSSDRVLRVDVDGVEMWVVIMVSPVGDHDWWRDLARGMVAARRIVVADADPDGNWWIGLLSSR